jgi:hypothetical protein
MMAATLAYTASTSANSEATYPKSAIVILPESAL